VLGKGRKRNWCENVNDKERRGRPKELVATSRRVPKSQRMVERLASNLTWFGVEEFTLKKLNQPVGMAISRRKTWRRLRGDVASSMGLRVSRLEGDGDRMARLAPPREGCQGHESKRKNHLTPAVVPRWLPRRSRTCLLTDKAVKKRTEFGRR